MPPLDYKTEVFRLNPALANAAYALSRNTVLADSTEAQAARARYAYAPANQPPAVIQCDTLSGDTWWSGKQLGERARAWTRQLTDGKGVYCTTQQEGQRDLRGVQACRGSESRGSGARGGLEDGIGFRPAA